MNRLLRLPLPLLTKLLLCGIISSCTPQQTNEKPEDILHRDTLVSILIEVHKTEGMIKGLRLKEDSAKKLFAVVERSILNRHGVLDSAYYRTIAWYYKNPSHFNDIYESVLDSLTLQNQIYEGRQSDSEEAMQDSIAAASRARADSLGLSDDSLGLNNLASDTLETEFRPNLRLRRNRRDSLYRDSLEHR